MLASLKFGRDTRSMKIGILQTGHLPDDLQDKHGDFSAMFRTLLDGQGFTFQTWTVVDGEIPAAPQDADGWLITGSRHGTYEDHPWIASLEDFLRRTYAANVPIIGVCFGHQILAQALGGKVAKYEEGWSIGAVDYTGGERIMAMHQDQVIEPPDDAETISSTDFCAHAMLAYGDRALSIQPHPEFTAPFMRDLIRQREKLFPEGMAAHALAQLEAAPLTSERYGDVFAEFFRRPR